MRETLGRSTSANARRSGSSAAATFSTADRATIEAIVGEGGGAAGVNPSDIGFDISVRAGQSNEVGQNTGRNTTYLDTPDPRVKQLAGSGTLKDQVITAVDPLFHYTNPTSSEVANSVGSGTVFGKEYVKTLPPNRQLLLVPTAKGGSGFTVSGGVTWDRTLHPAGVVNLFDSMIAQIDKALAQNPKNRVVEFAWTQMERDAGLGMSAATYRTKLDDLFTQIRTRYGADVLIVIKQTTAEGRAAGGENYEALNQVLIDTQRRLLRSAFVYGPVGMANPVPDQIHYTAEAQRILGKREFDALAYARANVLGVAPVVPRDVVLTQAGGVVTIRWGRDPGRVTNFKVQYRIGSGAWVDISRAQSVDVAASISGLANGASVQARARTINEEGTSAWSAVSASLIVDNGSTPPPDPDPENVVADDFNRPDSSSLGVTSVGDATWTHVGTGTSGVVSNRAKGTGGSGSSMDFVTTGAVDGFLSAELVNVTGVASTMGGGLLIRGDDLTDRVYLGLRQTPSIGYYALFAGATILDTSTVVPAVGDDVEITISGNGTSIVVEVNGEEILSATGVTLVQSELTRGLAWISADQTSAWDNWSFTWQQ